VLSKPVDDEIKVAFNNDNNSETFMIPLVNYAGAGTRIGRSSLTTSKQLRANLEELYRGAILLEKYCLLNVEAFEKIVKKHDKNSGISYKRQFITDVLSRLPIYEYSDLQELIASIEVCDTA
jgi:SPX domain protein involved in polyphosphate accumulation